MQRIRCFEKLPPQRAERSDGKKIGGSSFRITAPWKKAERSDERKKMKDRICESDQVSELLPLRKGPSAAIGKKNGDTHSLR